MSGKRKENAIISVENGVAVVDVSTPKFPNTVTLIDEADLPIITESPRRWIAFLNRGYLYVVRGMGSGKNRKLELLHRVILGLTHEPAKGDHVEHNTLDNRRSQLRVATASQNVRNSRSHKDSTSRFLGVSYAKDRSKWAVHIKYDGRNRYAGAFATEEDAARAYDAVARREFGEFANLNFPDAVAA